MLDYITDFVEINNSFVRIKNYKKKMITNFFPDREKIEFWIVDKELYKIEIGEVIYFVRSNKDFYTLYFIATNNEALDKSITELLANFPDETFVLDIVQREENSTVLNVFYNKSFGLYTSLVRMNRTIHQYGLYTDCSAEIKLATLPHLISLNNMLRAFFDEKAEQLPSQNELKNLINNKNVLIYQVNNQIGGFLIYQVKGSTLFLRYWFVHPDFREKKIGSKLFSEFEKQGKDITRQIFWVIRSNENALKRYRHYGFAEEKMYNFVLTNKKIKYES
jgi:GNAT superfamily N-acetyltransferase